ncbi:MAG: hypothetical protein MPW15_13445 [Candidatus Manganitrophus sp.]|nr:hypothetical protein [Candidatus Manganitrophus sp.]
MRRAVCSLLLILIVMGGCAGAKKRLEGQRDLDSCAKMAATGFRPVAGERTDRFLGKVQEETARCRGGEKAVAFRSVPPGSIGRTTGPPAI